MIGRTARRAGAAAVFALAGAAWLPPTASAQPFDGCPSAEILAAFDGFGRSGRMPIALGRWLGDLRVFGCCLRALLHSER